MSRRRFEDQVVVVSGGASGVGKAIALKASAEGAHVAIFDILGQEGSETANLIRSRGGNAQFYKTDVRQQSQVRDSVGATIDSFQSIDIVFNHAGTVIVKPFLETTTEDWNSLMDTNVTSMVHVCQATIPHMISRGKGSIVNTCSISGLTASALEVAYCVSKGACVQLTRAIAVEFRGQNIRCNGVCPGFIRTPHGMLEVESLVAQGQTFGDEDIAKMQGRICEPNEVATAALFLASDEASFINGELLVIDNAALATT